MLKVEKKTRKPACCRIPFKQNSKKNRNQFRKIVIKSMVTYTCREFRDRMGGLQRDTRKPQDVRCIHYFDCGNCYMVYRHQNLSNGALFSMLIATYQIYFNKVVPDTNSS